MAVPTALVQYFRSFLFHDPKYVSYNIYSKLFKLIINKNYENGGVILCSCYFYLYLHIK